MKRVLHVAVGVVFCELCTVAVMLHTQVKDFLWVHPWFHSLLVGLPAIIFGAAAVLDSKETNRLRQDKIDLTRELDSERNEHLQQIAKNTAREMTQAEKNAAILRKYVRRCVWVNEGGGGWPVAPEIVDITDDNLVVLFTPSGYMSATAFSVTVNCADLEIVEVAQGDCPIRATVIKRHGAPVFWGEIRKWEDRAKPTAVSAFVKGDNVYSAQYGKQGSSERRSLNIYKSKDDATLFMLEASTGEKAVGDRIKISKDFMITQIDYRAGGFERSSSGGGGELFIS